MEVLTRTRWVCLLLCVCVGEKESSMSVSRCPVSGQHHKISLKSEAFTGWVVRSSRSQQLCQQTQNGGLEAFVSFSNKVCFLISYQILTDYQVLLWLILFQIFLNDTYCLGLVKLWKIFKLNAEGQLVFPVKYEMFWKPIIRCKNTFEHRWRRIHLKLSLSQLFSDLECYNLSLRVKELLIKISAVLVSCPSLYHK